MVEQIALIFSAAPFMTSKYFDFSLPGVLWIDTFSVPQGEISHFCKNNQQHNKRLDSNLKLVRRVERNFHLNGIVLSVFGHVTVKNFNAFQNRLFGSVAFNVPLSQKNKKCITTQKDTCYTTQMTTPFQNGLVLLAGNEFRPAAQFAYSTEQNPSGWGIVEFAITLRCIWMSNDCQLINELSGL